MMGLGIKPVEIWRLNKNEDSCPDVLVTEARQGKKVSRTKIEKVEKRKVSTKVHPKRR